MKHLWDYGVNDRMPEREWCPSAQQLRQYAEASGDFNPIHLDEDYARKAGLGGVIAHGMLTMAQVGAMLTDWLAMEGELKNFDVRFQGMVRIGERLKCSGYIKDKDGNDLICDLKVTSEEGEKKLAGSAVVSLKTEDSKTAI